MITDNKTKQPFKKTAKLVVDAMGITSKLRNGLQNSTKVEREIDRRDVETTGRHIIYTSCRKQYSYHFYNFCITVKQNS